MSDHMAPRLVSRPARVLPVTILGVLGVALGIAALAAGVQRLQSGRLPEWVGAPLHRLLGGSALDGPGWSARTSWVGFAVLAVIAVVCLVGCLRPGRANGVELRPAERRAAGGDREVVMDNADVEGLVERWVRAHDGVRSVRVRRRGRGLVVRVRTSVADSELLRESISSGAGELVDSLSPAGPLVVRLRLR